MIFDTRQEIPASLGSAIDWEEVDCLLCGSAKSTPLVEARDPLAGDDACWFLVVQCQDCGLCYTNPRPTEICMSQFYPHDYGPHRRTGSGRTAARLFPDDLTPPHAHRASGVRPRLLDFGCGGGDFLQRMRQRGWDAVGVDRAPAVSGRDVRTAILTGSLPHADLAEGSFDVVTMWQALEHVHRPLEVLRAARGLLRPGGGLVVAVPNIDSMAFRLFGPAWSGLDLPRHLTHFAAWTLPLLIGKAGFEVTRVRMIRRSGWLRDSAEQAQRLVARPPLHLRWLRRRLPSTLASWCALLTGRADCMMAVARKAA